MAITDNFEAYTVGDLNGQGSWSGDASFDVQTSVVNTGSQAISQGTTGSVEITKSFTAEPTGNQVWYMRWTTGNSRRAVTFYEGATALFIIRVRTDIEFVHGNGAGGNASTTLTAGPSNNTWYKFEFEWDGGADTGRVRVNDGSWSSSKTALTDTTFVNIDGLRPNALSGPSGTFYWDDFSDPNAGAGGATPFSQAVVII